MSQSMSPSGKLCKHEGYVRGCLSCRHLDTLSEEHRAVTQAMKCSEAAEENAAILNAGGLSRPEREPFEQKEKLAKEQQAGWERRAAACKEKAARLEKEIADVSSACKPDAIVQALEKKAAEHIEELERTLRNATGRGLIAFQPESPAREERHESADRSRIPATPDCLVRDGAGLQVFLNHIKNEPRRPTDTVGERADPAFMSYGRALAMFGPPKGPGDNKPKPKEGEAIGEGSEAVAKADLETKMDECSITGREEPKTESEWRERQFGPPTTPQLSTDEQWDLFGDDKYLNDTAILAHHYVRRLAAQKEKTEAEQKEAEKTEPSVESSAVEPVAPESSTEEKFDSDGWPRAERHDWAGFTNFVSGCKAADPKFGRETIPSWNKQRKERAELVTKLGQWKMPPKFNESNKHPRPSDFYPFEKSLAERDREELEELEGHEA